MTEEDNKRAADDIASRLLHEFGKSLVRGDYDTFRSVFHIPCIIEVSGKSHLFSKEAALRDIFQSAHTHLKDSHIQDVISTIETTKYLSIDRTDVTAIINFTKADAAPYARPFPIHFIANENSKSWGISSLVLMIKDNPELAAAFQ